MKNFFLAVAALMLLVSCKGQIEEQPEVVFDTAESIGSQPATLNELKAAAIKEIWNKELSANGISSEVETLEIIQLDIETEDTVIFKSAPQYALKAVTKDKHTTLTALLVIKHNEFYFDDTAASIICSSECNVPCEPGAIYKNGKVWLHCSGCADCVKTDFMM
jgi:hypothetical protein